MDSDLSKTSRPFARYAWGIVGFLALIILWGAWVRISGSGAGCGNHWPDCNGQVIPLSPSLKTLTEYMHRLSTGLSLPLVLGMLVAALRIFPKGHGVRAASVGTLIFLITEALVGAVLVKFQLVAGDVSASRAITASFHLVNTFTLTAFAALAAWWAARGYRMTWSLTSKPSLMLLPGLIALLLTGMSGAVTALGDTLFPIRLGQHVVEHPPSANFIIQLRMLHPLLAVGTGLYLLIILQLAHEKLPRLRGTMALSGLLLAQLSLGGLNILLAAPAWMQLVHLGVALVVWLSSLLYWLQTQEQPTQVEKAEKLEPAVSVG